MNLSLAWIIVILLGGVIILLGSGMWVGLAIGTIGIVGIICIVGVPQLIGDIMWNAQSSYVLAAVPMFIFMGEIVLRSGMTESLYRGVTKWTSIIPGGLLHTTIVSCSFFAAVSGSSVAGVAALGTIAYPEQKKRGYSTTLASGALAAGGTLGNMIPPSMNMIMYGAYCNVPVGKLFMGTAIPGIIMSIVFMIYIGIRFMLNPSLGPEREPITRSYFPRALGAFKDIWPFLLLIGIIFGGIYGGVMTPTEAAAISGFVAMCLAAAFRKLTFKIVVEAGRSAVQLTVMIMLIIVSAKVLASVLAMLMIPKQLSDVVAASGLSPLAIWGGLIFMYFCLGCFMEAISMLYLTLGVVFPLMMSLGFDPLWFGVVFGILLEVALLTPPVGMNLYVCQGVTKEPFMNVVKGSTPFFLLEVGNIMLLTFFPILATWLPSTMG